MRWGEERAQATVEMAVTVPVLLVLGLIAYNLLTFGAATARFDRVAPDLVIAHGVSPVGGGDAPSRTAAETIREEIEKAMEGYDVEVTVTWEDSGILGGGSPLALVGSLRTFRCEMRYKPWPSGLTLAGVEMGAPAALTHTRDVVVDPWRPGVVL